MNYCEEIFPYLPEGWTIETYLNDYACISWPGYGCVTLDWKQRGYRLGLITFGRLDSTATYARRGWHYRLAMDAVKHLQEIHDGP